MRGTWQTDGHGHGGGGPVILAAVLILLLAGSGAVADLVHAVAELILAALALAVLGAAGAAGYLAYRARQDRPAVTWRAGQAPGIRERTHGFEPRALEPPAAREVHLHFHGVDPADVAEILRRHKRPE